LDHLGGLVGKMSKRMEYGTNMDVWYYNIIYICVCVHLLIYIELQMSQSLYI
jgi:hypothetical protein